ncbi:hypothetical protein DFJ74DRAFT_772585 [Hyaloraphidium curvatum]|nr:hypothetical protein DFJ74DRAFT_772585 [Hyaloraphidium curvatum]
MAIALDVAAWELDAKADDDGETAGATTTSDGGTLTSQPASAFSEAEWLAMFPAEHIVTDELKLRRPIPDPAAARRAERPLTPASMDAAFRARAPVFYWWSRFRSLFLPLLARPLLASLPPYCLSAVMVFLTIYVNAEAGGVYPARQLAAGTVANAFTVLSAILIFLVNGTIRRMDPNGDLDTVAAAPFVRWVELCSEAPGGRLLAHDDGDATCPCPRASCGGGLVRGIQILPFVDCLFQTAVFAALNFFSQYSLVVTLGGAFWTRPWSALIGTLWAITSVLYITTELLLTRVRHCPTSASFGLSLRMYRRATRIAMTSLVAHLETAARTKRTLARGQGEAPDPDLYAELHAHLAHLFKQRVSSNLFLAMTYFAMTSWTFVVGIINYAAGSCICAWQLAVVGNVLALLVADLAIFAVSNGQITDVSVLYSAARRRLRGLRVELARADPSGWTDPQGRQGLLEELDAHDGLLDACAAEIEKSRVRFGGFPVDFGVVRTFVITVFTVGVGLFTVFRGSMFVTLQSICPG